MPVIDDSIEFQDCLFVIIAAFLTTSIAELGMYIMIYSKEDYILLKKNIESLSNKIQKQRESLVTSEKTKNHEKKLNQMENQFKYSTQEMTAQRTKTTFVVGLFMVIALSSLGSYFESIVVARLPFQPISFISGMTHRGIAGDDLYECSYIFIYILSAIVFRTNIQKLFGFEPPRATNQMMNPQMRPF